MTIIDIGKANNSPASALMELVDVDHLSDFDQVGTCSTVWCFSLLQGRFHALRQPSLKDKQVVDFLKDHTDDIIKEVHAFDKLLLDNGKTQLNAPPAPEATDSHGGELLRTLSEKQGPQGLTFKREFKIHALGPDPDAPGMTRIEVREDMVGQDGYKENKTVVSIKRH